MTLACALGVKSESGGITAEEIGGDREELCPLQHDDDIGEDVTSEQADMVCESIIRQVTPQSATLVEVQTWVHVRDYGLVWPTFSGSFTASELPQHLQPSSAVC